MTNIAIMRCEKNENRCPLTSDFKSLAEADQGFAKYDECKLTGVFTCRCPGDNAVDLAKILKSKGAEAIHFVTCTFAKKQEDGWDDSHGGFCENLYKVVSRVNEATGLPCVLGTAHLPKDYSPIVLEK